MREEPQISPLAGGKEQRSQDSCLKDREAVRTALLQLFLSPPGSPVPGRLERFTKVKVKLAAPNPCAPRGHRKYQGAEAISLHVPKNKTRKNKTKRTNLLELTIEVGKVVGSTSTHRKSCFCAVAPPAGTKLKPAPFTPPLKYLEMHLKKHVRGEHEEITNNE